MSRFDRIAGFFRKHEESAALHDDPVAAGADPHEDFGAAAADLEERLIAALRSVSDPEIPVNIYDLGLIYGLVMDAAGRVHVRMTLTAPACPVAGMMPSMVEQAVRQVEGVTDVQVELVWDPPWTMDQMSEEARLQLGLM